MLVLLRRVYNENPQTFLTIAFCLIFTLVIFVWGSYGILREVQIDKSYTLTKGVVKTIASNFIINRTANVSYSFGGIKYYGEAKYFIGNNNIHVNDEVTLRVSSKKPNLVTFNINLSDRIIPALTKLFLSFVFIAFLIPIISRKLKQ